jgi:hypothetical protein
MSSLIVRRSGALHDPEVKPTVATFRDLRTTHTRRIKNMRAVSNSTSSLNVPSGLAQSAARRRSSRRMSSDAMTQLAISWPQRLITAFRIVTFVIRRLAMVPRSAASSLSDHEARYVNAFTRLGRVPAVRPHIGESSRRDSTLFSPMHSSTLLPLARTMVGSLLEHRAPSPGAYCYEFKSSHSLCC